MLGPTSNFPELFRCRSYQVCTRLQLDTLVQLFFLIHANWSQSIDRQLSVAAIAALTPSQVCCREFPHWIAASFVLQGKHLCREDQVSRRHGADSTLSTIQPFAIFIPYQSSDPLNLPFSSSGPRIFLA